MKQDSVVTRKTITAFKENEPFDGPTGKQPPNSFLEKLSER
jgi:hypothetical protein